MRARAVVLIALLWSGPAAANGRFPVALFLSVGPGEESSTFALSTTFGLVSSTDGGRTWQLTCEEGIGYDPRSTWDMTMAITAGGLVVGVPDGVALARQTSCTFTKPARPFESAVDLAVDRTGAQVAAAVTTRVRADGVALSDDGGATWRMAWSLPNFFITNVDIAPSDPRRLYASGYLDTGQPSRVPVVLRSEDGGQTFLEASRDFPESVGVYLSGVDARDADVVYARSDHLRDPGTSLIKSTDGGRTFTTLIATANPMTGVALAPDGRVWAGSPGVGAKDGVFRSLDTGQTWQRVASGYTTLCLRYHAGILYMCAGGLTDGFALGCSTNGGETFSPMLVWDDVAGPAGCPATSPGRELCQEAWAEVHPLIAPDGGTRMRAAPCLASPDTDGSADVAVGAAPRDAPLDAAVDAAGPTASGCSCQMARAGLSGSLPLAILFFALVRTKKRPPEGRSGGRGN